MNKKEPRIGTLLFVIEALGLLLLAERMSAERVGFEPTNRSPDLHLSGVPHYRSAIFPFFVARDGLEPPTCWL